MNSVRWSQIWQTEPVSCSIECATTESYTIKLLESSYGNIPSCSWPNHSSDVVKWSSLGLNGGGTAAAVSPPRGEANPIDCNLCSTYYFTVTNWWNLRYLGCMTVLVVKLKGVYRGGSPTAVQAWRPCPLWEPCLSHSPHIRLVD